LVSSLNEKRPDVECKCGDKQNYEQATSEDDEDLATLGTAISC
jgi:hypothetical protein